MITDSMGFFKAFHNKGFKITAQKKVYFLANLGSGGYTRRSGGYTTRIRRFLAGFFGFGATIRIGRKMLCLPYADFFVFCKLLVCPKKNIVVLPL